MNLGFVVIHPVTVAVGNELGVHLKLMVNLIMLQYTTSVAPRLEDWLLIVKYVD